MSDQTAVTAPDSAPVQLEIPTDGAAYDKWRLTGELPSEKDEESATSETQDQPSKDEESATSDASVTPAASEAAPPQKTKQTAEQRKAQLQAEIRELAAKAQQLRAEAIQRTPESRPAVEKPEPKAEAKSELKAKPKITDNDPRTNKPYDNYENFVDDLSEWTRQDVLREFETRQAAKQQEAKQKEFEDGIKSNWTDKVKQARTKYEDFDDVVMHATELPFKQGGIIDASILKYPEGADLAYYFATNPDEAKRIDTLDAFDAHAAILDLKKQFTATEKPKPSAQRSTKAPPPPAELGGTGTAKPDPSEQALEEDDFAAFAAAENARDIARRKKG